MTELDDTAASAHRSLSERILLFLLRLLVRAFFRRVEVTGDEFIPRDRGGILVAWHPNGLVDPTMLTAHFPGRVIFGAKHVLFEWPIFGMLLRASGAVPIFRAKDAPDMGDDERRAGNNRSLGILAENISGGSYAALFPEGVSHDLPYVVPLRSGVARLFYQVCEAQAPGSPPPVIIPVGLHYDEKHLFRSRALVHFYPPLEWSTELDNDPERVRKLTDLINEALTKAVRPTEDWTTHRLINRTRKLIRAERAKRAGISSDQPTMEEKVLGFARVQHAYSERLQSHPLEAEEMRRRIAEYDEDLIALGLDDHELDRSPPIGGFWVLARTALNFAFVMLALPPLLLLGYVINGPPALLVYGVTKLIRTKKAAVATQKILAGAVFFPLTWLGVVISGMFLHEPIAARYQWLPDMPILFGVLLAILSVVGAMHALHYQAAARQSLKNLRVRFRRARRRDMINTALRERAEIFDETMRLAEGLKLPGDPIT